jgi:hypothetical protein
MAVRKINIAVYNMNGQQLLHQQRVYGDGSINLEGSGVYILVIESEDRRFRHIQKLVRH